MLAMLVIPVIVINGRGRGIVVDCESRHGEQSLTRIVFEEELCRERMRMRMRR